MRSKLLFIPVLLATGAIAPSALADDVYSPPQTADLGDLPLIGVKDGLFYVRDPHDIVRLYPRAEIAAEARGFLGKNVNTLTSDQAGVDLQTKFFMRHARLELDGEVFQRFEFGAGIDLVANPKVDGAQARPAKEQVIALSDAWLNIDAGRIIQIMLGVFQAPFSEENRTRTADLAMMERNIAIRGFAVPAPQILGVAWTASSFHDQFHWDLAMSGAESFDPGHFQRHFDGMMRFYWKPFALDQTSILSGFKIGIGGRAGARYPRDESDDAPAINTGQGFTLVSPTRTDGFGRTIHILPSGMQYAFGGELALPLGYLLLRSEAYGVFRGTREAVEGYQATNTERLGELSGLGWYVEAAVWPLQASHLVKAKLPDQGSYPHPAHLELARVLTPPEKYGLQVAFLGGGIHAKYDGAERAGDPDPSVTAKRISIVQLGGAVNYWHTNHFRVSANGNLYLVPHAGTDENLAVVPGNLGPSGEPGQHTLWELGTRATLMF